MDELVVRQGRDEDLAGVLDLCALREYPPLPVRRVTGKQHRQAMAREIRLRWRDLSVDHARQVLVAGRGHRLSGVLVLVTDLKETITAEPQTLIHHHLLAEAAAFGPLLESARDLARRRGSAYLVAELSPLETAQEELFRSHGFFVDINRIGKRTQPSKPGQESSYAVRRATGADHLFILWLNSICSRHTIPAGRDLDPDEVAASYLETYSGLDLDHDPHRNAYIAERDGHPAGYLMVDLGLRDQITGEAAAYIYDLAIHPAHWGRRAAHWLMRTVEGALHQQRVAIFRGDVSEANPRALKTATRNLDFELEWRRWTLRLR